MRPKGLLSFPNDHFDDMDLIVTGNNIIQVLFLSLP